MFQELYVIQKWLIAPDGKKKYNSSSNLEFIFIIL